MTIEITLDDTLKTIIGTGLRYEEKKIKVTEGEGTRDETLEEFLVRKGFEYYQNAYGSRRHKIDAENKLSRLSDLDAQKAKITGKEVEETP